MSRRLMTLSVVLLCAAPLLAKSYTPRAKTRAAVKSYVQQAASVIAKKGVNCETFKAKEWMAGDYYIFVTGPDDRLVCHATASMVGRPNSEIVDSTGRHIGDELVATSKKKGGGWVHYMWPRPGQTNSIAKSSYVTRVKAPDGKWYMVGAGGYELK